MGIVTASEFAALGAVAAALPLLALLVASTRRTRVLSRDLARAQQRADGLMRALPIAVVAVDSTGRITRCAGGALEDLDWAPDDAIGTNIHDFGFGGGPLVRLAQVASDRPSPGREFQVGRRSIQVYALHDTEAWDSACVGIGIDVSPRVRAEEASLSSQRAVHALVDSIPHAVGMLELRPDGEYAYTFVNDAFESYVGRRKAEILGQTPAEVLPVAERATHETKRAWAIRMRKAVRYDNSAAGWPRPGAVTATTLAPLLSNRERCSRIIHAVRDVTDERAGEVRTVSTARVEQLALIVQGLSHHLNNLLQVVIGNAEVLRTQMSGSGQPHDELAEISGAATRTALLMYRLERAAGRPPRRVQAVALINVVQEAIDTVRARCRDTFSVEVTCEQDLPSVVCDPPAIHDAVAEVIENAIEAQGRIGDPVRVHLSRLGALDLPAFSVYGNQSPGGGNGVAVAISDRGVAMDGPTLQRSIDPFFTTKLAGRGLGLPLAVGTARANGGMLGIRSEPRKGTTVILALPAAARPPGEPPG